MSEPKRGFILHSRDGAPEASQPFLDQVEQGFGFIPNIFRVFAESPAATEAYLSLNNILRNKTAFTAQEQEVLLLAISVTNDCGYCVAAHTGSAERAKLDPEIIESLRGGKALPDSKLNALATFACALIEKRGWVSDDDVQAFLDAGYTRQHLLDALVALSMKTISNYTNHLADTPLDEALQPKALKKAS